MGKKLQAISNEPGLLLFWCPGCKEPHSYWVKPSPDALGHLWAFNGDMERPTFTPSLLVNGNTPTHRRCHLFLTDGVLYFCADSQHELAGKSVPLPDWEPQEGGES